MKILSKVILLLVPLFMYFTDTVKPQSVEKTRILPKNEETISSIINLPVISSIWLLNPVLLFENNKPYFGLTKEVSILFVVPGFGGHLNFGKIGLEYSYIFRKERNNHLRLFTGIHTPIKIADFIVITLGIGGGYFTDLRKKGLFPEVSGNIIVPTSNVTSINLYLKARHTFMLDKRESNITDFSLGIGFSVFIFGL